jgi:hypothetical protein
VLQLEQLAEVERALEVTGTGFLVELELELLVVGLGELAVHRAIPGQQVITSSASRV